MAIGTLTPETLKRQRLIMRALEVWVIVGIFGAMVFYFITWPPSPRWGVPTSPERILLAMTFTLIYALPIWIWSIFRYSTQQRWLAEDIGVPYEPGKIYPVWTPRRIVACALGIALFGISGIVPATTFDLPQFVATFLTVLYGPIEGGIGVGLGYLLIRGPIFSGVLDPATLVWYCVVDGAIYFAGGHFYRHYIYYKPLRWRMTVGLVSYVLFINFLHAGWGIPGLGWGVTWDLIAAGPLDAMLASRAFENLYWCPIAWLPNIILAYLVASALQKYKV